MASGSSLEQVQRRLAAALRYRDMARYTFDPAVRAALIETAAEFERAASRS